MCIYLSNIFSSESTISHTFQFQIGKYNKRIIALISIHYI